MPPVCISPPEKPIFRDDQVGLTYASQHASSHRASSQHASSQFASSQHASQHASSQQSATTNISVLSADFSKPMEFLELTRRLDFICQMMDTNLKYTRALCKKNKISLAGIPTPSVMSNISPEYEFSCPSPMSADAMGPVISWGPHRSNDRKSKREPILTKALVRALSNGNCNTIETNGSDKAGPSTLDLFQAGSATTFVSSAPSSGSALDIDKVGSSALQQATVMDNMAQLTKIVMEHNSLREQRAAMIWRFLEDKNSGFWALMYFRFRCLILFLAVVFACIEVIEASYDSGSHTHLSAISILELAFEICFAIELGAIFMVCPFRRVFWRNLYNIIDLISVLPCVLRILVISNNDMQDSVHVVSFFGLVPVIRLLKVLRHFETFQLLLGAFRVSLEAMPMLMFNVCLIILTFGAVVYFCEPRTNIPSLPVAFYMAVVTLSTVGYGDVTAESESGRVWICFLAIMGPMYMAIPVGIIGNAFNDVWEDRHRLLLLHRMRNRVINSGYTPRDLRRMFQLLDKNSDGTLDYDEFVCLIEIMQVNADEDFLRQVFANFDADHHGEVDFHEFLVGLFPHTGRMIEKSCSAQEEA